MLKAAFQTVTGMIAVYEKTIVITPNSTKEKEKEYNTIDIKFVELNNRTVVCSDPKKKKPFFSIEMKTEETRDVIYHLLRTISIGNESSYSIL